MRTQPSILIAISPAVQPRHHLEMRGSGNHPVSVHTATRRSSGSSHAVAASMTGKSNGIGRLISKTFRASRGRLSGVAVYRDLPSRESVAGRFADESF